MWVFKYKTDFDGYVSTYKARLIVRGDLQYTKENIYAATLAIQTFRCIMAITCAFDLEVITYNVKNIYVNALLCRPILCKMPPGFEKTGKILSMLRALYGLRHSANL